MMVMMIAITPSLNVSILALVIGYYVFELIPDIQQARANDLERWDSSVNHNFCFKGSFSSSSPWFIYAQKVSSVSDAALYTRSLPLRGSAFEWHRLGSQTKPLPEKRGIT